MAQQEEDLDLLRLRRILAAVDTRIAEALTGAGLTVDQWRLLALLVTQGPRSMAHLAAQMAVPAATLTRTADRLCTSALAYRAVDPADRRRVVLHAAERGAKLHAAIAPAVRDAEMAGLRAADAEDVSGTIRVFELLSAGVQPEATLRGASGRGAP